MFAIKSMPEIYKLEYPPKNEREAKNLPEKSEMKEIVTNGRLFRAILERERLDGPLYDSILGKSIFDISSTSEINEYIEEAAALSKNSTKSGSDSN